MSPAVADGVVYVPADSAVLALDAATGGERWRAVTSGVPARQGEDPWTGLVAVGDGVVFATSNGHVLRALDAATGAERWRLEANADGWVGDPVVADGAVYVWSDAGAEERARAADAPPPSVLRAIDAMTGVERWSHRGVGGPPTVGAGAVFLSSDAGDGTGVVALDATTGQERWSMTVEGFVGDTPLLAGGVLYFGTFDQGPLANLGPIGDLLGLGERNYLYALDAATGRQLWRIETPAYESAPAVADGTAFLVTGGGEDHAGTLHAYGEG
ncbi:MAG: PQQ-binding-like beta-propeller repeat protein [Chloroflexota bacterium]|nr:PQQ-binding-like beta-propeller repeat protein [Chloroflexota bacterium]